MWYWKGWMKLDLSKSKIYHYNSDFKDEFYKKDWGVSHSCFTNEPFGYGIFEGNRLWKITYFIHKLV